ncbi:uncharacterized protein LOC121051299 [Rosa chinensis]|uniref:uncharacterized protein LOC121051299 n=1 Tax=Rosa chinensis TaxID=74649 RepID=UPI001AD8AB83|nr:uncharacterized protein LOC121051299 [Rosa chinensis]
MDYDLTEEGMEAFHSIHERLSSYMVEKEAYDRIATLEVVNEELGDPEDEEEVHIQLAPAALDDTPPKVKDPTEKINLGTVSEPMEVSISAYLEPSEKQRLVDLLLEFKDCFAEKYEDMPGLSPDLVCHQLPTLAEKRPVKQEPRRMNAETQILVKEEKNGKIRVCVDYRDLNLATPKDVYPMPVADMLVDAVAGHELLSFMDGTAGYHQIPVAEEDRHKTAFRCPGFAGVFEYVIYIDDVVVKSQQKRDHIADLRKVFERMRRHKLKMNPAKCVFAVQAGDFLGFIVHQRGIEVPADKASAVINASPPRTKKELQRLLACKLRHYMLSFTTCIITQTDLVKYMLSRPILRGRIGKWVLALSEFSLQYVPQKAVKGQAIADFLAHHPPLEIPVLKELEIACNAATQPDKPCIPEYEIWYQATIFLQPWVLFFYGSRTDAMAGAGIVLENPAGDRFSYSFQLTFQCTNNQAEYEALIIGLEVLLEMGVRDIQVRGDSQLVINQLLEKYRCTSWLLIPYLNRAIELLDQFTDVDMEHIPRERNFAANELAQLATGITLKYGVRERILKVERRTLPSWLARPDPPDDPMVAVLEPIDVDWRIPLIEYLKRPDSSTDRKIRFLALNYFLRGNELRRRGEDGVDFRCVYGREAKRLMREVHMGICGSHQAGPKMRWLIRRHGYYWPSILKDCIAFAKGCADCQAHGPVQHVPNIPMQPIIKPWPARGWALDLIGMIHPHSSLQHKFIIVATDYFTKWVEAEPLKEASGATIRQFIFRNILCRFGIPEVLVSDRGAAFMGGPVEQLVSDFGIQFIHSTPYYAQSNGQAEASNKTIITLLKKMLVENPRQWHDTLYETLWAYRTSKRNPTATTPYALMFGHDAILPLEINVHSLRVQEQHHLIGEDYVQAMWQEHEDLSEQRLAALDNLILLPSKSPLLEEDGKKKAFMPLPGASPPDWNWAPEQARLTTTSTSWGKS